MNTVQITALVKDTLSGVGVDVFVAVPQGCPMRSNIDADTAEFYFPGTHQECTLSFDPEGLRGFLDVARRALADLDANVS